MANPGFGRKGVGAADAAEDDLARRRDAFIAAERARQAEQPSGGYHTPSVSPPAASPASHLPPAYPPPPKSMALAYVLWFFACGISAHRFYLGAWRSALCQLGLVALGLMVLVASGAGGSHAMSMLGMILFGLAWAWMLLDAFLIPGLLRRTRAERPAESAVFA